MTTPTGRIDTVHEALAAWAMATPDAIALLSPGWEPIRYRELQDAVVRLGAELRACGLGRDDGIALIVPDGPELCGLVLAVTAVGIAVPLAWPLPEAEYRRVLAHRRVRAVVTTADIASAAPALRVAGCPVFTLTAPSSRLSEAHLEGPKLGDSGSATAPDGNDIALILQSSGTTGRPKLVPRLHRNNAATCRAIIEARALTAADRCLSLSPTAYSQGLIILMTAIVSGGSLVSVARPDLEALPAWLRIYRPTYISTTPVVLRAIASDSEEVRDALREAPLRCVLSSTGPLSTEELGRLESILGAPILNTYGMSEASFIAGEPFPEIHRVPGSVGLIRCDIQILDENGDAVGRNQPGEIAIRGPRVFPGYLDDDEANAAAFLPGGWFRTGDVGFLDDAGYLHLTDRLGEVINRGGEKVAPREVDAVLASHPAVAEAAVFGVPSARLGEDIVAAVVFEEGRLVSARELRRWMLDRLSRFKVPRQIWVVEHLPRTLTGKVQRGELARRWVEADR